LLLVGMLLAVVGVREFTQRVWVARDPGLRAVQLDAPAIVTAAEASPTMQAALHAWFPVLRDAAENQADPADPKSWQFALVGMFAQQNALTGVVAAWLPGSTSAEIVRVAEGTAVHDWKVTQLAARRVTLALENDTRELVLFKSGNLQPPHALPDQAPVDTGPKRGRLVEGRIPGRRPRVANGEDFGAGAGDGSAGPQERSRPRRGPRSETGTPVAPGERPTRPGRRKPG
jgi:hypothetical protein